MAVQPSLRIVSTSDDFGPANALALAPHIGLEVDVQNPTNKSVTFALVVELFQQGTLNLQTLANMHNSEPNYKSKRDDRVYTKEQQPYLTQVPLQLTCTKATHGNAKRARVAGRVQVVVKLVEIHGNTYAVIEIIAHPHSGVVGERFTVNLTIEQQRAHAYRISCYKLEQDTFLFQHDYFFVLRNGGSNEDAYRKAAQHFPTIWNIAHYGKGPAHNDYFSNSLRNLIPTDYVHPVFTNSQDVANTIVVQSVDQKGSLKLDELNYDRVKREAPKRSKKQATKKAAPKRKCSEPTVSDKRQKIQEEFNAKQDYAVLIQTLDLPQSYYQQVAQLPVAVPMSPSQTPMTPVTLPQLDEFEVPDFLESFEESTVLEQLSFITRSEMDVDVWLPHESEVETFFFSSPENNSYDYGFVM
jgi:hypothetical protein